MPRTYQDLIEAAPLACGASNGSSWEEARECISGDLPEYRVEWKGEHWGLQITWTTRGAVALLTDDPYDADLLAAQWPNEHHRLVRNSDGRVVWISMYGEVTLDDRDTLSEDPTPTHNHPIRQHKMINVSLKRENAKLMLTIDATGLHETLDAINVSHDGGVYLHRPSTASSAVDIRAMKLSTDLFLRRTYPVKVNLSEIFAEPPSLEKLRKLANTSQDAARKILEHYQPIDISVNIQKKLVK